MPNIESTSESRDRECTGVCFKNLNKRADKHPDWIGKATIQGKPYEVALWEKTSLRNGELFFSMSFRPAPPPELSEEDRKWLGTSRLLQDLWSVIERVNVVKATRAPQLAKAQDALVEADHQLELVCSPEYTNNPVLF